MQWQLRKVCLGHDPNRTRGPHAAEPMDGVLSVILGNEHLGLLDSSALNLAQLHRPEMNNPSKSVG